jgi:hypothetical protein
VQRDHRLLLVFHRLAVWANTWLLFHHFLFRCLLFGVK